MKASSIVVVDDQPENRLLLKKYMDEQGHVCHTAGSGKEALELMETEEVDLALIDVVMPQMTGLTLFHYIRDLYPDMATVFVTAINDLDMAVEHLKTGAYDYIVKPVTRKRSQQVVEEALTKLQAILEDNQRRHRLEEQVSLQAKGLEAKDRELSSLNRVFQARLSEQFGETEAEYLKVQASKENQLREAITSIQIDLRRCRQLISLDPGRASSLLEEMETSLVGVQKTVSSSGAGFRKGSSAELAGTQRLE